MSGAYIISWASVVLLTSIRVSMVFIATPVFGGVAMPILARTLLVLGLAAGLSSGVAEVPIDNRMVGFPVMLIREALVGGAIAAGLHIGFGALQFGGRLLDFQIGFGFASLVDIATKTSVPLLGNVLSMLTVLIFFTIDGHHALIKVLQLSLEKFPIGGGVAGLDFGALVAQFGACFTLGFIIVAPVVLCLLMIDFGMALMSRTMPQMNIFVLSLGLKVFVGLAVLATMVPLAGGAIRRIFDSIFVGWGKVIG